MEAHRIAPAIGAVAATLLLISCGAGGRPSIRPADVVASSTHATTSVSHNLLYIDDAGSPPFVTNLYREDYPHFHVGRITGLFVPRQIAVDMAGNVYVADSQGQGSQGDIKVYSRGLTTANRTLSVPNAQFPWAVCVAHDGTVYSAIGINLNPSGPRPLYKYAPGSNQPTAQLWDYRDEQPLTCALDSTNDLFVLHGGHAGLDAFIDEFTPGSTMPITLGISFLNAQDIGFDKSNNMIVVGTFKGVRAVYVFAPGATVPMKSFDSTAGNAPYGFALSSAGKFLFVADECLNNCANNAVLEYNYSTGAHITTFLSRSNRYNEVQYLAVDPTYP